MNCQEFWNSDDQIGSGHLKECPACASAWLRQQRLVEGLRVVAREHRWIEAPAHLEDRLAAAFRRRQGMEGLHSSRPYWAPVATGFSAAAVLALVALLFLRVPEQPRPARRSTPPAVQFAANEPLLEFDDAADEFVPVPNAAQLESDEDVHLVRVEVPRSALAALGYEMDDDGAPEPVSADVMLGADGLIRAVRLLSE